MGEVINPQPTGKVRHDQPHSDVLAIVQAGLTASHLQIKAGSARRGKARGDRAQRVQRRAEHLVHAIDLPLDLTRRHERGYALAQLLNRTIAGIAMKRENAVVGELASKQCAVSASHPLSDLAT